MRPREIEGQSVNTWDRPVFVHNLNHLFGKVLRGEAFTSDEIEFTMEFVSSNDLNDAIIANSILTRVGTSSEKAVAFDRLRQICEAGLFYDSNVAVGTLAAVLEHFSKHEFAASACFATFIYRAAEHQFVGARINAMRVLRQMASTGDQKAIQVLKRSLNDQHEHVRSAAETALKLANIQ